MTRSAIPLPGEDHTLTPVSPKLLAARRVSGLIRWLIVLALAAGWNVLCAWLEWPWWTHLFALPLYLLVAQSVLLLGRRTRAIAYAVREHDVLLRTGIMFRSIEAVPFGRVQDIEIDEGPIERRYGLSTITVKTAGSDITIPGLEKAQSEHLRAVILREAAEQMAAL